MTTMLTKPPPPPPMRRHTVLAPKPSIVTGTKQLAHYPLPMAGEYKPAWVEVLQSCGYPTDVIVIDFETYHDDEYCMGQKANALSTIEYVMDERFEILGVGTLRMSAAYPFADYDQQTHFWMTEKQAGEHLRYLQGEYGKNYEQATVVIQNAKFDATILSRHFGIYPPFVVDVLCLSRHLNSRQKHGLETLTAQNDLIEKGDTSQFSNMTFRPRVKRIKSRKKGPKLPLPVPKATPEQMSALAGYGCNDVKREWEVFTLLLPKLSNPKIELRLMQHTLELFTKPVLKVDPDKGKELVVAMEAEIDKVMDGVGATREEISGDLSFARLLDTALEQAGDLPQKYYKVGKRGYLLAIAKTDPERELLLNHESPRVRALLEARVALDSWPTHIGRVHRILRQAAAAGGLLPVPLKYCGAHTARWSGDEKINLQNLGSRGHELVNAMRLLIVAPDGRVLVIVDAAAIEARVLAWVAGQHDLVEKFAANEEVYCGFASKVLGYPVRKAKKSGGIPAIEARMTWARNSIGKIGVLGCGYGMGTSKIHAYAKGAIDLATAEKIKETYRAENAAIVKFWTDIERAFAYTAKYQRPCDLPRGLRFDSYPDCDVVITLPNGRELHYPQVRVKADEYGRDTIEVYNSLEHYWGHVWGGHLTENVVQAISRDVLAECFLRMEDHGYHTAHHIHDEIVMCVPADKGPTALKLGITEMSRTPIWAPGMPLGAEGVLSDRYGKH